MPVPEDGGASLAVDAFLHTSQAPPDCPCGEEEEVDDGEEAARQEERQHQPHGVFHAHAHDMAYLEEWIGEMLNISRNGGVGVRAGARCGQPRKARGWVFSFLWYTKLMDRHLVR